MRAGVKQGFGFLAAFGNPARVSPDGEQSQESAQERAEGLIHAGLKRKGWTERKTCKSAARETSSRWVLPDCRATEAMAGLLRLFVPRRFCKS